MSNTNYDSSAVGAPFVRVKDIRISYPQPNVAQVVCTEEDAVVLTDGTVRSLGERGYLTFDLGPQDMAAMVPLVHPATGAELGQSVAHQQVMLGILAAIRAKQKARDAHSAQAS